MKYYQATFFILFILFQSCTSDSLFNGYATASISNNKIEYSTHGQMDLNSIQPIASVSKVFIGIALVKAVELGYLNIDDDINLYLNFNIKNPHIKNNSTITIRHLATHTSGIKDNLFYYNQSYTKSTTNNETLEEYLTSYFIPKGKRYSKSNFIKKNPGEEYIYSNIASALAAYIIEKATNMPFEIFTQEYIFKPLEMKNTHWHYSNKYSSRYLTLYNEFHKPIKPYSLITYPDGGLRTNIVDLSYFLQELIYGYSGKGKILSKLSWELFYKKNEFSGIDSTHGIFISHEKSGAIGHTGSDPGVSAFMFFNPINLKGKIFMANEDLTNSNIKTFKSIWENIGG